MSKGIVFKNNIYVRDVEMLGDVESIKWFKYSSNDISIELETEVYDQTLLDDLEITYENTIINTITPAVSII